MFGPIDFSQWRPDATAADSFASLVGGNGTSAVLPDASRTKLDSILTGNKIDLNSILGIGQQSETPAGALDMLKDLASKDPAYMELYLTMLRDKESADEARKWYEDFNNSYYQRTSEDLKKAGMNPWLALTHGFGAGNGSIIQAGSGQGGVTSAKATQSNAQIQAGSSVLKGVLGSVFAILGAMILSMV